MLHFIREIMLSSMAYLGDSSERISSNLVSSTDGRFSVGTLQSRHRCFQQDSSQFVDSQLDPEFLVAFDEEVKFGFLADPGFGSRRIKDT
jgi:hypothetical protein